MNDKNLNDPYKDPRGLFPLKDLLICTKISRFLFSFSIVFPVLIQVFQQVSNPATEGYQNWSSVEVASWFAGTGCHRTDQVERELKTMDGKFLWELCCMQELSPESFRIFLKEDFGFVQSLDLLRFSNAVSFLRLSQAEN